MQEILLELLKRLQADSSIRVDLSDLIDRMNLEFPEMNDYKKEEK